MCSRQNFEDLLESVSQKIKVVLQIKRGPTQYQQGVPNKILSKFTLVVLKTWIEHLSCLVFANKVQLQDIVAELYVCVHRMSGICVSLF